MNHSIYILTITFFFTYSANAVESTSSYPLSNTSLDYTDNILRFCTSSNHLNITQFLLWKKTIKQTTKFIVPKKFLNLGNPPALVLQACNLPKSDETGTEYLLEAQNAEYKPAFLEHGKRLINNYPTTEAGIEKILQATEPVNGYVYMPALEKALEYAYDKDVSKNQKALIISKVLEAGNNGETELLKKMTYQALKHKDTKTTKKICNDHKNVLDSIILELFPLKKNTILSTSELYIFATILEKLKSKELYTQQILELFNEAQKTDIPAQIDCAQRYAKGLDPYKCSTDKSLSLCATILSSKSKSYTTLQLHQLQSIIEKNNDLKDAKKVEKKLELLAKLYDLVPQNEYGLRTSCQKDIIDTMLCFMDFKLERKDKILLEKAELIKKILDDLTKENEKKVKDLGIYTTKAINLLTTFWGHYYVDSVSNKKKSYLQNIQIQKLEELLITAKNKTTSTEIIRQNLAGAYFKRDLGEDKNKACTLFDTLYYLQDDYRYQYATLLVEGFREKPTEVDLALGMRILEQLTLSENKDVQNKALTALAKIYIFGHKIYDHIKKSIKDLDKGFICLDKAIKNGFQDAIEMDNSIFTERTDLYTSAVDAKNQLKNALERFDPHAWIILGIKYQDEGNSNGAKAAYTISKSTLGEIMKNIVDLQFSEKNDPKVYDAVLSFVTESFTKQDLSTLEHNYLIVLLNLLIKNKLLLNNVPISKLYNLLNAYIKSPKVRPDCYTYLLKKVEKILLSHKKEPKFKEQKLDKKIDTKHGVYDELKKKALKNNKFRKALINLHYARIEHNTPFLKRSEHIQIAFDLLEKEVLSEQIDTSISNKEKIKTLHKLSNIAAARDDYKTVRKTYDKILQLEPDNTMLQFKKILFQIEDTTTIKNESKRFKKQNELIQQAEKLAEKNSDIYNMLGILHIDKSLYGEMIDLKIQANEQYRELYKVIDSIKKDNNKAFDYINKAAESKKLISLALKGTLLIHWQEHFSQKGTIVDGVESWEEAIKEGYNHLTPLILETCYENLKEYPILKEKGLKYCSINYIPAPLCQLYIALFLTKSKNSNNKMFDFLSYCLELYPYTEENKKQLILNKFIKHIQERSFESLTVEQTSLLQGALQVLELSDSPTSHPKRKETFNSAKSVLDTLTELKILNQEEKYLISFWLACLHIYEYFTTRKNSYYELFNKYTQECINHLKEKNTHNFYQRRIGTLRNLLQNVIQTFSLIYNRTKEKAIYECLIQLKSFLNNVDELQTESLKEFYALDAELDLIQIGYDIKLNEEKLNKLENVENRINIEKNITSLSKPLLVGIVLIKKQLYFEKETIQEPNEMKDIIVKLLMKSSRSPIDYVKLKSYFWLTTYFFALATINKNDDYNNEIRTNLLTTIELLFTTKIAILPENQKISIAFVIQQVLGFIELSKLHLLFTDKENNKNSNDSTQEFFKTFNTWTIQLKELLEEIQ